MAGLKDFIFGKGALNKAAGGATVAMTPPAQPANLDVAKAAEDMAKAKRQAPTTQPKPMPRPINKKAK